MKTFFRNRECAPEKLLVTPKKSNKYSRVMLDQHRQWPGVEKA